jgi:hypothetical protein
MAKQSSFIKLEGTIGDVTFYKTTSGFKARQKGGVSKTRIMTDPAFQRTRENLAEFNRASAASKLLKDSFRVIVLKARDPRTQNRIYRTALKVVKSDPVSLRGERVITQGDMQLFDKFQFNQHISFESTMFAQFEQVENGGNLEVNFESFVPQELMAAPMGSSHFRVFLAAAGVDFSGGKRESSIVSTDAQAILPVMLENFSVAIPKVAMPGGSSFYALGIEFLQEVNGELYSLNNGAHNAARIILVE